MFTYYLIFPSFSASRKLNDVWQKYALSVLSKMYCLCAYFLLKLRQNGSICENLIKCDLHGAHINIVRSKVISSIGCEGTIVCETKNTISIIDEDGKVWKLQKKGLVFSLSISSLGKFHLFGDQLISRSSARSSKKIKWKPIISC